MFHVHVFNKLLHSTTQRGKLKKWMKYIENYPNWLGQVDREILVETSHGFNIYCDREDYIGRTIIDTGEWEPLVSRSIVACLREGDLAIDVGANIGYDSLLMSSAVGELGQVLAFEPNMDNLFRLLRNINEMRRTNICVQSIALSEDRGWGAISLDGEYGHANLRNDGGSKRTQKILTLNLDRLLKLETGQRIQLVKMDVEGFEHKVLLGMVSWLPHIENVICEIQPHFLERCGSSAQALFDLMRAYGFRAYCTDMESDDKWVPGDHTFRPRQVNMAGFSGFDTLFCRSITPELQKLIENS